MLAKSLLGLFALIVIFAATYAQDIEGCQKIEKALACCKIPKQPENAEGLIDALIGNRNDLQKKLDDCMNSMKDDLKATKPDEALGALECLAECMLNDTKIMTPDYKFNKDVAFKLLSNDPEYKEFAKKHMDICEEKIAKLPASGKCKGSFVFFVSCMIEQTANNCPQGGPFAGSPDCKEKNLTMDKCNPLATLSMLQ